MPPRRRLQPDSLLQGLCLKRVERQCNLNGIIDGAEECDDGNQDDGDDCTNQCRYAFCGDGTRRNTRKENGEFHEECDFAQFDPWQYCTGDCRLAKRPRKLAAGKGFTCYLQGHDVTCWGANFDYPNHGLYRAEFYTSGDQITNIDVVEMIAWTGSRELGSPFYKPMSFVNRPTSPPASQLTGRYPSLF